MGDFNSEPNKRLRFTPPLASRGAGTIIAAGGAAAAKHGTVGEGAADFFQWGEKILAVARRILVKHRRDHPG